MTKNSVKKFLKLTKMTALVNRLLGNRECVNRIRLTENMINLWQWWLPNMDRAGVCKQDVKNTKSSTVNIDNRSVIYMYQSPEQCFRYALVMKEAITPLFVRWIWAFLEHILYAWYAVCNTCIIPYTGANFENFCTK